MYVHSFSLLCFRIFHVYIDRPVLIGRIDINASLKIHFLGFASVHGLAHVPCSFSQIAFAGPGPLSPTIGIVMIVADLF